MNKKITAEQFLDAFREQWNEEDLNGIRNSYSVEGCWTGFMLGYEPGNQTGDVFLSRVASRLLLDMDREWRKLDCVYYKKESSQINGNDRTPACLDVIIEHENYGDIEQEMYKLLIFRSPLKVLICYDYREDEKENCELKNNWLDSKLGKLLKMGSAFGYEWPETHDTEYLFLVGNRAGDGDMPRWRHMTVRSGDFVEWPSCPPPLEFL